MKKLLISVAAIVAIVVIWAAWPRPSVPSIELSSGAKITLLKVTTGPKHICRYATGWKEIIYPIVPQNLQAKLKPRLVSFRTPTKEMMFWFQIEGPIDQVMGSRSFCFSVADENGLESRLYNFPTSRTTLTRPAPAAATTASGKLPSITQLNGWIVDTFPHRAKKLRIRIYQRQPYKFNAAGPPALDQVAVVGEFTVPNLRRSKPAAEWTAEALPATRQTNGLRVTLLKLETGLPAAGRAFMRNAPDAKSYSQATFRLTENGQPAANWMIAGLRATAVTSETHLDSQPTRITSGSLPLPPTFQSFSNSVGRSRQFEAGLRERRELREVKYDLPDPLWPEEPAWKLDVSVVRSAQFAPEELWVIKGICAPNTDELVATTNTLKLDDQTVELIGLLGPGAEPARTTPSGRPFPSSPFPREQPARVQVRMPLALKEWRFSLLEVQDENGRQAPSRGIFMSTRSINTTNTLSATNATQWREFGTQLRAFGIQIPEGAEKLDITFSVTRVRHVEFTVKPTMFVTNKTTAE